MKILFLSLKEEGYSRTWTYFTSLQSQGADCEFLRLNRGSIWRNLKIAKKSGKGISNRIVIGSASQLLVIPSILVFKTRPFLDAGWSLFESTIVNRTRAGKFHEKAIKAYLIDFVATIFSRKVFLESKLQVAWYKNIFFVRKEKCITLYTGLDESEFMPENVSKTKSETSFKVVFRGKNNDEAGLEILAQATKILADDDIDFEVISNMDQSELNFSERTKVISKFYKSKNSIASVLAAADLSLGQLSNHTRLSRTIPHKAFESAFLGIPYLTARNSGILEIFQENEEIFCFDSGSAEDLVAKIRFLKSNRSRLEKSGKKLKEKYSERLSQKILAQQLMGIIRNS